MSRILRPKILIGTFAGLLALYTLVGFVLIPYAIKAYGVPAVEDRIKHPVTLRDAAFNPFALSLRLTGLEIREQDQTPILGFEEFVVNLRAVTLLFQKVGFDEIRLVMPFVAAKVHPDGKLNLAGLVPPSDQPEPPPSPPPTSEPKNMMPIEIGLLGIDQGIVEYRDESKRKPVAVDIVPIQITLRNFSTIRSEGSENAYAFTAEIGKGETVAWEGTISLEPVESDGKLSVSGIKLKTLYQAVQDQFQFDVRQGELALSASYHFDMRGQAPQATVKNGRVSLGNLELGERGALEPVVTLPTFDVEGIQFDLEKQTIDVATVRSADARFDAWLESNGVLNYQPLFTPVSGSGASEKPTPAKASPEKPAKPWAITVGEVGLKNYRASFEDRTLQKPGHVDVDALNLTVKDLQIPFKKPLPIELSLKLNETGSVGVKGKVTVEPLMAETDVTLEHIEIRPFQPYLDRFLNADVRDGAIDLHGAVRFAKVHANGPLLRFQGNLAVNQLAIAHRNAADDVVSWKALNVNRIDLDVEPTAVKIAEVVWQEPSAQIVVEADGKLNFSRFAALPQPGQPATEKKEPEGKKPADKPDEPVPVTIDQIKLVKMAATFQDLTIQPNVRTSLTQFGGTIKGLSSKQLKKADVDLTGKVGRTAPLKIVGKINPLSEDAFTDLIVTLGGMDLASAGPYSGKYVGYGLSKGKLSLDLKYKVSQKVLEAENLVRVDHLTFGDKTNSPDATSLPVPLVVGLLKDRKGLIEIDMPIRGNLNDPDFKYGKVVISTLLNVLGKVVASPFSLMGKLIPGGGEGEEGLQFIEFQPGSAAVAEGDVQKLEALEKVLDERAGLRLDITGTTDAALDRTALQAMKLREQLLAMKGVPRGAANSDQAALSPKDEQRLLEKLYAKLPPPDPTASPEESAQPTIEDMKRKVAAAITIPESELATLARQRAETIRNRLLESGALTEDRVSLLDPGPAESGHEKVRTQLTLSAGS
jgi:Domain of Unknown Function (DUF748)